MRVPACVVEANERVVRRNVLHYYADRCVLSVPNEEPHLRVVCLEIGCGIHYGDVVNPVLNGPEEHPNLVARRVRRNLHREIHSRILKDNYSPSDKNKPAHPGLGHVARKRPRSTRRHGNRASYSAISYRSRKTAVKFLC